MSRRSGIIFLAVALLLIVLLNGAWFYSYQEDQPSGSALSGSQSPQTPSSPDSGSGSTEFLEGPVVQPEKPPQIDPEEDKALFDHNHAGTPQEQEPGQPFTTTTAQGPEAVTTVAPGPDVLSSNKIDWSRFAYVQYVTATEHVCNSVMVCESLHRLGSKADRVILYPHEWGPVGGPAWKALDSKATTILIKARDEYHVKLRPVDLIREKGRERMYTS